MKIVINRTDAIGDTILTLPMAQLLKEKNPNAEVIFIISERSKDLFKDNPFIDDLWILKSGHSFIKKYLFLLEKFIKHRPNAYIYVGGSQLPSLAAIFSGVKFRGGLRSKFLSFIFLNKGLRQHRTLITLHESDQNLMLLEPFGVEYDYQKRHLLNPRIYLSDDEVSLALDDFKKKLSEEKKTYKEEMIFIHPGMAGHTLNWSSRNYGRFIQQMEEARPDRYLYVISHTPGDIIYLLGIKDELKNDFFKKIKDRIYFFNGAVSGLRNYMSTFKNASLFLGPSTGNIHIANTLGVKTVGIYSPIKAQSTLRWAPFNLDSRLIKLIVPDVVCGEIVRCAKSACPYYECMGKIEVQQVVQSSIELLGE